MELFPNYYDKFECIAGKCKHSCCIGWEIDIDDDTLEFYNSIDSEMGDKIRKSITGDIAHFKLTEGERCPHLNERGLCDIILEYGDGALCDICAMHPRFVNCYRDFDEIGLGLCCEEAARIVLFEEEKFHIDVVAENEFFAERREIVEILQNREKTIDERFNELSNKFGFELDFSLDKLTEMYRSLERLGTTWDAELDKLQNMQFNGDVFKNSDMQIPFEQLACYFIFRHMTDTDYKKWVKFTIVSCWFIGAISSGYADEGALNKERVIDVVRMYSSEIEYSEENLKSVANCI